MTFAELRLKKPLLDAVQAAGYETPTPIQARMIPLAIDGRDIMACAQTGTGKTAAFALPILQRLGLDQASKGDARRSGGRKIRSLVLAPTRELAGQIAESFSTYGGSCGLKHTVVFGGVSKGQQAKALRAGVDILIATPGRLLDHLADGAVSLESVEVLVLDEADRMLDMGFIPSVRRILKKVPVRRQTLLLSATMPPAIRKLANDILTSPTCVEVARVSAAAENIEHWSYRVEQNDKPLLLSRFLEHTPYSRALVFTRTKRGADRVVRNLSRSGVEAVALHGNKSQNARTRALEGFRSGKTSVLVATDIAARGLDVDDISHVINYDLTTEPETYVHRIGRTARAGASGTALSFVSREDAASLRAIERMIREPLRPAADLPASTRPLAQSVESQSERRTSPRREYDAKRGPKPSGPKARNGFGKPGQRFAPKKSASRRPRGGPSGPRSAVVAS